MARRDSRRGPRTARGAIPNRFAKCNEMALYPTATADCRARRKCAGRRNWLYVAGLGIDGADAGAADWDAAADGGGFSSHPPGRAHRKIVRLTPYQACCVLG